MNRTPTIAFRMFFSLFLLLCASLLDFPTHAQETTQRNTRQAAVSSSAGLAKSPAASTGDLLIREFEYEKLAATIASMPPSTERDYYSGVLANRSDDISKSIALLIKVLPQVEASNPSRAAVALHALADDYIKRFRYSDALPYYESLLHHFALQMDREERQSVEDDYHAALLLKNAPPQTVTFSGPVDLITSRNTVLDTIDTKLTIHGVQESWILDTGANFSTISASYAKRLGLKLSKEVAQTQGITGAENTLHTAILPELQLGGATVHNVVLLVLDDHNLNVATGPKSQYQVNAILGYPVLHALQRITFTQNGHLLAGPDSPSGKGGARLYMKELTPLLECGIQGRKVLFSFDTGAGQSIFSSRFRETFPQTVANLKSKPFAMGGAGGVKEMEAVFIPDMTLKVGETQTILHMVPVVIGAIGTDMDRLYGNLGRDLVDPYQSFTIDFEQMRFAVGEKPAHLAAKTQLENVLVLMDKAAASFQSIETNFVWDQYQAVVQDHDVQEGTMYFRRNGKTMDMAADITKPNKKYVLFTNGVIQIYVPPPGADQITRYNAGKNRADFENFLVLGFGGRGQDLEKSFDVKYAGTENIEGKPTYKLELTPKTQSGKNLFQLITLWIDQSRGVSLRQKFLESSGDYRLASYNNIKLNEKLPPSAFKLKTTSNTTVLTPQE